MQTISQRRVLGSFYTPDWIARWMISRALTVADAASVGPDMSAGGDADTHVASVRILDPACGDGAFVLPILEWMAGTSADDASHRLEIVRRHLFGVDADPQAIASLHRRVADWIGGGPSIQAEVDQVLATNFVYGDALLGQDWADPGRVRKSTTTAAIYSPSAFVAEPVDWSDAFPHVARDGGFDLVIGNPPYRRELNAKEEFDRIARSVLGQRWRTARMDLWHYFFHRGLDLLKPGGCLSFIVNSYWMGSTAAKPVRERMAAETTMEEIVMFGAVRLFRNVSGRHTIFRLRKLPAESQDCRVLDLTNVPPEQIKQSLDARHPAGAQMAVTSVVRQSELWKGDRLQTGSAAPRTEWPLTGLTLGNVFEVRQGMAENPPFVTKAAAEELGDPLLAGTGVFVLTADEVAALSLNDHERSLLRPYYALSTVRRFQVAPEPSHHVLYLTRNTAGSLDDIPGIARHLKRFRPILERRREARTGKIAWWHLHWPREERLFNVPRVLCIQMGPEPRFAFAESPTFVGFSMNLIVARPSSLLKTISSMAALTAILNSSRARGWFADHAKQRGVHLDISGTVLKNFPLPPEIRPDLELELDRLARTWPAAGQDGEPAEMRLDRLVGQLFL